MVAVLEVANNNYFASFLPVSCILIDAFPYRANTYYTSVSFFIRIYIHIDEIDDLEHLAMLHEKTRL